MGARQSLVLSALALALLLSIQACQGVRGSSDSSQPPISGGGGGGTQQQIQGVLRWKGDNSNSGIFTGGKLTPASIQSSSFGVLAHYQVGGDVHAQPLYVSNLDMGALGTHNVVIIVTEHDDVWAFDADGKSSDPLWSRSYLGPNITTASGIFGGRTGLGPEVGITGTPVIDPSTGAMYFVTLVVNNGVYEQWLRAIDIRTGKDFGPGSVKIQATVDGDGPGSDGGKISFDPSVQNQRSGLALSNGQVLIAWGSFSDLGIYRGWLMAYDAKTLTQTAAYSPATQYQSQDAAGGPSDHGGGASIWSGGAAPAIDSAGNIYVVTADGSFNADTGGDNYGNSVLKLKLANGKFQVLDYYAPSNKDCLDYSDLEIGSGGLTLLPGSAPVGAMTVSKEGRLYLLNPSNLGKLTADDSQIPQVILVGDKSCQTDQGPSYAEGTDWQRMYGTAVYWNGNVYVIPANDNLVQYRFAGAKLDITPAARSSYSFYTRGGSPVLSANGTSGAILWVQAKDASSAVALYAFDANDVSKELWNNQDGALHPGAQFVNPVIADSKLVFTGTHDIYVYGLK